MASMRSLPAKERFTKYHEPALSGREAPNAQRMTLRLSRTLPALSFLASEMSIARPDALPLAPGKVFSTWTPSTVVTAVPRLSRRAPITM